jgi:hypothetical protein
MQRCDWMSENGYKSGVLAEKKLAKLLKRQALNDAAANGRADEWMARVMLGVVGVCLLAGLIFGAGMAALTVGGRELIGVDSGVALAEVRYSWRVWVAGLVTSTVVGGALVAISSASLRKMWIRRDGSNTRTDSAS